MRRVIVTADHLVTLQEVDVPAPQPGEVLVRMTAAGLCGSDRHAVQGRHPFIDLPYAPGHEVTGVVEQLDAGEHVGAAAHFDAAAVRVGQRVIVEPTLPCWDCKQCRAGQENLCERLRFFGCGHPQGGLAELFTIPADRLHPIPDELDDRRAILIEPLATPVHAARLAGSLSGRTIAILGGGPIGLLLLAVARHHGAAHVVLTDRHASKLAHARAHGADALVDAREPHVEAKVRAALGESADVVFDCVATQDSVDQAVALAGKGGSVVIVGVAAEPVTIPLPLVQDQQLRIQGSATYLPEDFREAMVLLAAGVVDPQDYVTAAYPLDEAAAAFDALASGEQLKVIVTGAAARSET
jgi:2-desacetyl-2-hydroxyethyl bacteriochlorophyllide A dehydrogenase